MDNFKILISEDEIKQKIKETGKYISKEYRGKPLMFVCILRGAFVFMSDLMRSVDIDCIAEFMAVESYNGTESTGNIKINLDLKEDISKYHVIIAEDIIDTGRTLEKVVQLLRKRNPLSLKIITLLDKPARRVNNLKADISLFTIPDVFVIVYGLDYNNLYRNLPFIATNADQIQ